MLMTMKAKDKRLGQPVSQCLSIGDVEQSGFGSSPLDFEYESVNWILNRLDFELEAVDWILNWNQLIGL